MLAGIADTVLVPSPVSAANTISFGGYTWDVKTGQMGPGPDSWGGSNYWSASSQNVWVDASGGLHLKITQVGGTWYCAEVTLTQSLGYGQYIFQMNSRVDQSSPIVVESPFFYQDDNHEVDIEFTRWAEPARANNAQYVVSPSSVPGNMNRFHLALSSDYSTHVIDWEQNFIHFTSARGQYASQPAPDNIVQDWAWTGTGALALGSERMHINIWLYRDPAGQAISDEFIVGSFTFIPSGTPTTTTTTTSTTTPPTTTTATSTTTPPTTTTTTTTASTGSTSTTTSTRPRTHTTTTQTTASTSTTTPETTSTTSEATAPPETTTENSPTTTSAENTTTSTSQTASETTASSETGSTTDSLSNTTSSNSTSSSSSTPPSNPATQRGCIIATAAYGSPMALEVAYMRHVRDDLIGSTPTGRKLVSGWNTFYYLWSPPIASVIGGSSALQAVFQVILLPLVGIIHVTSGVFSALGGSDLAAAAAFAVAAFLATTVYVVPFACFARSMVMRTKRVRVRQPSK